MQDNMDKFLRSCAAFEFGTVVLSEEEKNFCTELNNEIHSLCKSLPQSSQAQALLWLMKYFQIPIGQDYSFFMNYYVPAWSIIYWLIYPRTAYTGLQQEDIENAKAAHSMALLLHPLDDHLIDGQLQVTHLNLLLRSQAWMIMNNSMRRLAESLDDGKQTIKHFINDYYTGINNSGKVESLDRYVDLFRKQMATGFIVPVLLSKMTSADEEFAGAVKAVYGSFGISWRLLDDINDIQTDMMMGTKSAIYTCLPENIKKYWDEDAAGKNRDCIEIILNSVEENCIIERIKERICAELEFAANTASEYQMTGLADEIQDLANPLQHRPNLL